MPARDPAKLQAEIAKAKARFGLAPEAPVCTCYEAGRDGFWLHRALAALGIRDVVVAAGSVEVGRRSKHAKTGPIDAGKLVNMLGRYHGGERKVWSVVSVPAVADEGRRQLRRGLKDVQRQQAECSNRILGLLAPQGLTAATDANFRTALAALRGWAGRPVPAGLRQRIWQECAVGERLHRQVRDAADDQERQSRGGKEPYPDEVRRPRGLRAVGVRGAWVLVTGLFARRDIKNGKELGALVGLTPVPYDSGKSEREPGSSKAGDQHVRALTVELARRWLRWQPGGALSRWYQRRFGAGNKRARKVGIVALARERRLAWWRYVEQGELPAGAEGEDGRLRVDSAARRHAKAAAAAAAAAV